MSKWLNHLKEIASFKDCSITFKSAQSIVWEKLHHHAFAKSTGSNGESGFHSGVEDVFIQYGVVGDVCPVVNQ